MYKREEIWEHIRQIDIVNNFSSHIKLNSNFQPSIFNISREINVSELLTDISNYEIASLPPNNKKCIILFMIGLCYRKDCQHAVDI